MKKVDLPASLRIYFRRYKIKMNEINQHKKETDRLKKEEEVDLPASSQYFLEVKKRRGKTIKRKKVDLPASSRIYFRRYKIKMNQINQHTKETERL